MRCWWWWRRRVRVLWNEGRLFISVCLAFDKNRPQVIWASGNWQHHTQTTGNISFTTNAIQALAHISNCLLLSLGLLLLSLCACLWKSVKTRMDVKIRWTKRWRWWCWWWWWRRRRPWTKEKIEKDLRSEIQGWLTHTQFQFEYNAKRKSYFRIRMHMNVGSAFHQSSSRTRTMRRNRAP